MNRESRLEFGLGGENAGGEGLQVLTLGGAVSGNAGKIVLTLSA